MIKSLLFAFFGLVFRPSLLAQTNFPENGVLLIDTVVPGTDIAINPDSLDWLYANVYSYIEFHAKFVFDNGIIRDTIDAFGFRLYNYPIKTEKGETISFAFKCHYFYILFNPEEHQR